MIVRFHDGCVRKAILKNRSVLKGNKIVVHEDVSRDLMLFLNRAKNDEIVADSWIWNGVVWVKQKETDKVTTLKWGEAVADAFK